MGDKRIMTILGECEICGHKWEIELKPRETIQCPNCKRIFYMIKVMNDPQNEGVIKWLNSQSKEIKEK